MAATCRFGRSGGAGLVAPDAECAKPVCSDRPVPVRSRCQTTERQMSDYTWTGGDLPTFVTHLECSMSGERYEADRLHGLSSAGRPLLVRYDLDSVRGAL